MAEVKRVPDALPLGVITANLRAGAAAGSAALQAGSSEAAHPVAGESDQDDDDVDDDVIDVDGASRQLRQHLADDAKVPSSSVSLAVPVVATARQNSGLADVERYTVGTDVSARRKKNADAENRWACCCDCYVPPVCNQYQNYCVMFVIGLFVGIGMLVAIAESDPVGLGAVQRVVCDTTISSLITDVYWANTTGLHADSGYTVPDGLTIHVYDNRPNMLPVVLPDVFFTANCAKQTWSIVSPDHALILDRGQSITTTQVLGRLFYAEMNSAVSDSGTVDANMNVPIVIYP